MENLVLSVGSNFLASAALAVLVWLVVVIVRSPLIDRQRRDLFRFFGITRDNHRFVVYFSTLFVVPGGAVDFKGTPRSFGGPAIPAAELGAVQPMSELFVSSFLQSLPGSIRQWLGEKAHWTFRQISPVFSGSPRDVGHVEPVNMLTVGSQYYNAAGDLYAETGNPFLKMEPATAIIRIAKGPRKGDVFEPRPNHIDDLAIVEKLYDEAHGTSIFIAAGLGVVGTLGAVDYLTNNWNQLLKDYGTEPFAVCLRFQDWTDDPRAYKRPVVLFSSAA